MYALPSVDVFIIERVPPLLAASIHCSTLVRELEFGSKSIHCPYHNIMVDPNLVEEIHFVEVVMLCGSFFLSEF